MKKPYLTRRGLLAAAGAITAAAVLRQGTRRAMAEPMNDFKSTMTTMFWVGERADAENAYIPNPESSWDQDWLANFGGIDDPWHRNDHWPTGFTPKENPFYVALPYGEFGSNDGLKADAQASDHALIGWRSFKPNKVDNRDSCLLCCRITLTG